MNLPKLKDRQLGILVFLAGCAAYLRTVRYGFVLDDIPLIVENPLLKSWASLPRLLATGYWEAAEGRFARVQEFRPLSSLGFFLQYRWAGAVPWPYHLVNILLHGAVCALLYVCLRRNASTRCSLATALAFAVLPIHVDAVANVASRPEPLVSLGMLGAWWFLGRFAVSPRQRAWGLACFAGALLCKEDAAMFPAAFAAADWFANGRRPWDLGRRAVTIGLWSVLGAYLILRGAVLGRLFHGGAPYFSGVPLAAKVLTLSKFWLLHYAVPTVTGAFQCADFSRPLIPLARFTDPVALLSAIALVTAADLVFVDFPELRPGWAFWLIWAGLFLLPTSHLLFPLDTIGAERFLYVPSLAWCAALGWAAERELRGWPVWPALVPLLFWYGGRTWVRERIWQDPITYYSTAAAENPEAAGPRYGLGAAEMDAGRPAQAETDFQEAARLDPYDPAPLYDLGHLAFDRGDLDAARERFQKALALDPNDPDALVFLGLVAEKRGDAKEAADWFEKALRLRPWDARAHFSLGRALLESGQREQADKEFREFLSLAPQDPSAPEARRLLESGAPPPKP